MGFIKGLALIALVMTLIAAGVLVGVNRGWINQEQLKKITSGGSQALHISQSTQGQLNTLTERSGEVGGRVQNVLGSYVQVNEDEAKQPIHERALEEAQYLYCKGIVAEYERNQ